MPRMTSTLQVVLRPARGNWRQDAMLAPKQPELGMRHLALEVLHLPTYCCNNVINVQNAPFSTIVFEQVKMGSNQALR